jgi:hypothetical protein
LSGEMNRAVRRTPSFGIPSGNSECAQARSALFWYCCAVDVVVAVSLVVEVEAVVPDVVPDVVVVDGDTVAVVVVVPVEVVPLEAVDVDCAVVDAVEAVLLEVHGAAAVEVDVVDPVFVVPVEVVPVKVVPVFVVPVEVVPVFAVPVKVVPVVDEPPNHDPRTFESELVKLEIVSQGATALKVEANSALVSHGAATDDRSDVTSVFVVLDVSHGAPRPDSQNVAATGRTLRSAAIARTRSWAAVRKIFIVKEEASPAWQWWRCLGRLLSIGQGGLRSEELIERRLATDTAKRRSSSASRYSCIPSTTRVCDRETHARERDGKRRRRRSRLMDGNCLPMQVVKVCLGYERA